MSQLSTPTSYPSSHSHLHHHHSDHPEAEHAHSHGVIDPTIAASARGLWAVKWSLVGLIMTAVLQAVVFWLSGSVALLADLIHNIGDALTAVPLGVAFVASRRKPTPKFAYGYGRMEDLAGLTVVGVVLTSALITAYESIDRFYHPQPLQYLGVLAISGVIGFIGNEAVALFRIRVGKEINSAALIADGRHARADGLVSLSVVVSALGVWLGYDWADPVMGIVITVILLRIVWESGQTIFSHLLDGVDPAMLTQVRDSIEPVVQLDAIQSLRARWLGHRLQVEVAIAVDPGLTVAEGHEIATKLEAQLQHQLPFLNQVAVQIQPARLEGKSPQQ
ncbi:MAG: cation diffusion facilitator family transporter [Leptolyngbyaceae cyanobacterium]